MSLIAAIIGPIANLIDKIVPDPEARDGAKEEFLKAQGSQELQELEARMSAIVSETRRLDSWTSRARLSFLYVIYAFLLWSIPMGLISAVDPGMAESIARGMTTYLRGIPEELYALFGTGYLGYTAARAWGKAKGVDR